MSSSSRLCKKLVLLCGHYFWLFFRLITVGVFLGLTLFTFQSKVCLNHFFRGWLWHWYLFLVWLRRNGTLLVWKPYRSLCVIYILKWTSIEPMSTNRSKQVRLASLEFSSPSAAPWTSSSRLVAALSSAATLSMTHISSTSACRLTNTSWALSVFISSEFYIPCYYTRSQELIALFSPRYSFINLCKPNKLSPCTATFWLICLTQSLASSASSTTSKNVE